MIPPGRRGDCRGIESGALGEKRVDPVGCTGPQVGYLDAGLQTPRPEADPAITGVGVGVQARFWLSFKNASATSFYYRVFLLNAHAGDSGTRRRRRPGIC
jgi:hypothetical protein